MIKKYFILLLTFIFFLSVTALPISVHNCKMEETVLEDSCGKCSNESNKEDSGNKILSISNAGSTSSCCTRFVIDKTVNDNFIIINQANSLNSAKLLSPMLFLSAYKVIIDNDILAYSEYSPLNPYSNKLYLYNSILLI